jgi:quercetin dioxygenase-like cupin family protein
MSKRGLLVKRSRVPRAGAGAVALAMMLAAGSAWAGGCPAGKEAVDARPPAANPASGVTDTVVGSIDVSKEPAHIDGRLLRLRKLVIQPGGVVPWHSHHDRPAIIVITKGTIVEYASNCSVPIVHAEGDVSTETSATAHWWRNETDAPVELYSADLFPTQMMGTGEEHKM